MSRGLSESKATGEGIALGRFREPLVSARFGRTRHETRIARVAGYAPKRLPRQQRFA
jgi:hypothetical protein